MPSTRAIGWGKFVAKLLVGAGKKPGLYPHVVFFAGLVVESPVGFARLFTRFMLGVFRRGINKFIPVDGLVFHSIHTTNNKRLLYLNLVINRRRPA